MAEWETIKRNQLPTNLIPYKDFDEELDIMIVTYTLLGWEITVDLSSTSFEQIYYVQFDKYDSHEKTKQVNLIIYCNKDSTKFLSMVGETFFKPEEENRKKIYFKYIKGETIEEIKKILFATSEVLQLKN